MTISELKSLCATFCEAADADITLAAFLGWANEASLDLAPVARIRVRSTADWEGGTEFALPADLAELRQLTYDGDTILPYNPHVPSGTTTYTRWGNIIVFSEEMDAADIAIHYYRRLTTFTLAGNTPEIPVQFHRLYALWAAARFWKFAGDEPAKEASLRSEYESLKAELDRYTLSESGPRGFRKRFRW